MPKFNSKIIRKPIFEWYVVKCGYMKEHQEDIMWLGGYTTINEHENLQIDNEHNIHMGFENFEANDYMHNLDLLISSHWLHIITYKKWVQTREIYPNYTCLPQGVFRLVNHNHDCCFLNTLIGGEINGTATPFYTRSPKIRVIMSKNMNDKMTWNPTCQKMDIVWWSLIFCSSLSHKKTKVIVSKINLVYGE